MMNTSTAVLEHPVNGAVAPAAPAIARTPEPLLREALGLTLRAFRADKGVTLRELAGVPAYRRVTFRNLNAAARRSPLSFLRPCATRWIAQSRTY